MNFQISCEFSHNFAGIHTFLSPDEFHNKQPNVSLDKQVQPVSLQCTPQTSTKLPLPHDQSEEVSSKANGFALQNENDQLPIESLSPDTEESFASTSTNQQAPLSLSMDWQVSNGEQSASNCEVSNMVMEQLPPNGNQAEQLPLNRVPSTSTKPLSTTPSRDQSNEFSVEEQSPMVTLQGTNQQHDQSKESSFEEQSPIASQGIDQQSVALQHDQSKEASFEEQSPIASQGIDQQMVALPHDQSNEASFEEQSPLASQGIDQQVVALQHDQSNEVSCEEQSPICSLSFQSTSDEQSFTASESASDESKINCGTEELQDMSIELPSASAMDADNVSEPQAMLCPPEIEYKLDLGNKELRKYQLELAKPGLKGENYIICAPTGTGKTLVSAVIIANHLNKRPRESKVIFMVNTLPLAKQQTDNLTTLIPQARVESRTGDDSAGNISNILSDVEIVVCTSQKFLNELQSSKLELKDISLIIIDECHHTRKNSPQANMMIKYLEEKQKNGGSCKLPQVIGLTASPGAGDSPTPDLEKTVEHLMTLCALMDAGSGIKTVVNCVEELEAHTNKPKSKLQRYSGRKEDEKFIQVIADTMKHWELQLDIRASFPRWSQAYENHIQQKRSEMECRTSREARDSINMLSFLFCLSRTLKVYMDLRYEDAICHINKFSLPSEENATRMENILRKSTESLKSKLSHLERIENPLLYELKKYLVSTFETSQPSKGIIFVTTKNHASCLLDWITTEVRKETNGVIKAALVTGHSRETGEGMTDVEQQCIIKGFHEGVYNLLVATSVLEEGIDVPACNLVIRYQHVTNEIAKVQAQGRARAIDSEGLTILSSTSKKAYQEILNDEKNEFVKEALTILPSGRVLARQLIEKQVAILKQNHLRNVYLENQRSVPPDGIMLKCKLCKTFACAATDIYTLENATQFIVPSETFKERYITRPAKESRIFGDKSFTDDIFCKECQKEKWGVIILWPKEGKSLPTLRCKAFVFEKNGMPFAVKKWSVAPFQVPPFLDHVQLQSDDDDM